MLADSYSHLDKDCTRSDHRSGPKWQPASRIRPESRLNEDTVHPEDRRWQEEDGKKLTSIRKVKLGACVPWVVCHFYLIPVESSSLPVHLQPCPQRPHVSSPSCCGGGVRGRCENILTAFAPLVAVSHNRSPHSRHSPSRAVHAVPFAFFHAVSDVSERGCPPPPPCASLSFTFTAAPFAATLLPLLPP